LHLSFEQQLSGKYAQLSQKLQEAADFVVSNPVAVASRSLRAVAKEANLSPATFSRMSAALGYESYEALRDVLRTRIEEKTQPFAAGVDALQKSRSAGEDASFSAMHIDACSDNLTSLRALIDRELLDTCIDQLSAAQQICVAGALGSATLAQYLVYMANFISDRWRTVSRAESSFGSAIAGLSNKDVLIVITKPPFAALSIEAARLAREKGAFVLVITDTHTCPALVHANAHFIMPTASPHFYSSYASTLVFCEIMIGMLAARAGPAARARIAEVESANQSLSEVWGR